MRKLSQRDLLACCASRSWAAEVAARQPYRDLGGLIAASAAALTRLEWADVEEALAAHPRIGDRASGEDRRSGEDSRSGEGIASGGDREAAWSRAEQAGTANADDAILDALRLGNEAYEKRFGHIYLICATGRTAAEMLDILLARLANDEDVERKIVRDELAKIVRIRLAKLPAGEESGES